MTPEDLRVHKYEDGNIEFERRQTQRDITDIEKQRRRANIHVYFHKEDKHRNVLVTLVSSLVQESGAAVVQEVERSSVVRSPCMPEEELTAVETSNTTNRKKSDAPERLIILPKSRKEVEPHSSETRVVSRSS